MRGTSVFAELSIAFFGLAVWPFVSPAIAQTPVDVAGVATGATAANSLQNWMQFGLSVALVLIHTLWTNPGMLKDAREERKQFLDELAKHREGFKCHGAGKAG